jgi:hypothetical protein
MLRAAALAGNSLRGMLAGRFAPMISRFRSRLFL